MPVMSVRACRAGHGVWRWPGASAPCGPCVSVFLAPGWSRVFRLPEEFGELVVVADRFRVKPLLAAGHRFYVLALSQNQVRLLEGTPHDVHEVAAGTGPVRRPRCCATDQRCT